MTRKEVIARCKAQGYAVTSGCNWADVEGMPTEEAANECYAWFNGVTRHGGLQQDADGSYSFRFHLYD